MTHSRNHVFERWVVQDERMILQAAIDRSMGEATYRQVRQEFQQRVMRGELGRIEGMDGRAAPQYWTAEMVRLERQVVGFMQRGNEHSFENPMLISPPLRSRIEDQRPELTKAQLDAVDAIFPSRDKTIGLDGIAGAGKTTTLAVIREGAEMQGYMVEGFAPTSRAAQKLSEAGMKHLRRS
jgi:flagellar biosynthesis GTPase FlhF